MYNKKNFLTPRQINALLPDSIYAPDISFLYSIELTTNHQQYELKIQF